MEPVYEYLDDDMQNPFFDVLVDNVTHGQIDLYIILTNAKMRKFTASIPLD